MDKEDKRRCYECKLLEYTEEHFPFCSQLCHDNWAEKNYKNAKEINQSLEEKLKKWKIN